MDRHCYKRSLVSKKKIFIASVLPKYFMASVLQKLVPIYFIKSHAPP